jgi:hypothetical protein
MPIQQIFFDRLVARLVGAGFGENLMVLPIIDLLNPPVQLSGKSINPIASEKSINPIAPNMKIIKICHNKGVQTPFIRR